MGCARTQRSAGPPRWTWRSTCSTACGNWDAQPTCASPKSDGVGVNAPAFLIRATCVDAPLGARRIVVLGAARRRVLTCVDAPLGARRIVVLGAARRRVLTC